MPARMNAGLVSCGASHLLIAKLASNADPRRETE
jgi:hypothetical protein